MLVPKLFPRLKTCTGEQFVGSRVQISKQPKVLVIRMRHVGIPPESSTSRLFP